MAQRVYVKVDSTFDETGYMTPKSMIWKGKVLPIESVIDFRPAVSEAGRNLPGDCYTIKVNGEEKHLFFQKTDLLFPSRCGRWFVEIR